MISRRQAVKNSAAVTGMLLAAGMLPQSAFAFNKAAFDAKTVADVMKAMGAGAPTESKDVTLTAPDIAENGAVVPLGAATALSGVKHMLILVEKKTELMHKLGKKQLTLQLQQPLSHVPPELVSRGLTLSSEGSELIYTYDAQDTDVGVAELLKDLADAGIHYKDLRTEQSSLEDIFVSLVTERSKESK